MRSGLNQGYFARSKVTVVNSEPHSIAAALLSNTTPLTEKKNYMIFNDRYCASSSLESMRLIVLPLPCNQSSCQFPYCLENHKSVKLSSLATGRRKKVVIFAA